MAIDLEKAFKKFGADYLEFDGVIEKKSSRADLHAFILLDSIQPGKSDMVSNAEHDRIFLSIDCEKLAEVITEEQVEELSRCGVRYSSDYECLTLFV